MTYAINEDAVRRMANLEDEVSVTAGSLNTEAFYRRVERQCEMTKPVEMEFSTILGLFLNRARRDRSLSLEQLADYVDSNTIELFLIEEGKKVPEPRIVSQLSRVLNVPAGPLMQLAGHVQIRDERVISAATAYVARSNSKPLDQDERGAPRVRESAHVGLGRLTA
jgi:transcriptional regulator with XRE-family HTH domain